MAKVVIFGVLDTAELAHYYLENDSDHEVVAFTVSKLYFKEKTFKGLPVVPFEDITKIYPPNEFKLFAPMTAKKMNELRKQIYLEGKSYGYEFISYVHSQTQIFNNKIGENCFILENNMIRPFTSIGNNVVMWKGNNIGQYTEIKDHGFISSHVLVYGRCVVKSNCYSGGNASIKEFSHLSKGTLLGMGVCLILKKIEEWGIYVGNPAKKTVNKLSHQVY